MKNLIITLTFLLFAKGIIAQQRFDLYATKMDSLSASQLGLNGKVQVSVTGIKLADFISAISLENNLNVSVDDNLNTTVVNNFYDAQVKDVFLFLAKKYDLVMEFTGTIISFKAKPEQFIPPVKYTSKPIDVKYNPLNQFLSLDLKRDSLSRVAEAITRESGNNVILAPNIKEKIVSVYIENRPFTKSLDMMAKSNGMKVSIDKEGFYYLEIEEKVTNTNARNSSNGTRNGGRNNTQNAETGSMSIEKSILDNTKLDVIADNTSLKVILESAASQVDEHYFMYDIPEGNATLNVKNVSFQELMANIFNGTEYTFKKQNDYFIIGKRATEALRATELVRLENRSIENVLTTIPTNLIDDVAITEFPELNGLILSGSFLKIEELKKFLNSVDVVVPMVQIDVLIVLSRKSSQLSTGIDAGVGGEPAVTGGSVFPGLDMTLGAETINGLINAFNGFGLVNIGAVTPNFYLSLKALESNSIIEITSTPKISTLNGNEASFSVGETSYYQEELVNIQPSISGGNVISNRVWKSIDANLDITVKPFVSADEFVTLEIKVEQSDFAGKEAPSAPPNITTQTFESLIRVKNGEMILMGGLDSDSKEDSGTGTPLISRIPILKWFFSSRNKNKEKSKLHIFIKPTVTY